MQLVSRLQFNLLEVSIIALQESNLRWSTFLKSTGYTCFNVSIFFSPFTFFFFFFFSRVAHFCVEYVDIPGAILKVPVVFVFN